MAEVPMRFREGPWFALMDKQPGDVWRFSRPDGSESMIYGFTFACPGCGQLKTFASPQWTITGSAHGNTLTVTPSLHHINCGWHGYLTDGVFRG